MSFSFLILNCIFHANHPNHNASRFVISGLPFYKAGGSLPPLPPTLPPEPPEKVQETYSLCHEDVGSEDRYRNT